MTIRVIAFAKEQLLVRTGPYCQNPMEMRGISSRKPE
jgi:hypothetical protein